MARVERNGRNYRLREGRVTIVSNLGRFRQHADTWKVAFDKACAQGFTFTPPIKKEVIREFLEAAPKGNMGLAEYKRIPIEQMCDLFLEHHGPSVQGGKSEHWTSNYRNLGYRLNVVRRRWAGKMSDDWTPHDVRDYVGMDNTVAAKLKSLALLSKMFRSFQEWNAIDGELPIKVRLPASNPALAWRSKLRPAEKQAKVDSRVLEPEEWARFWHHLTPRARRICDIALNRFLSLADIKNISKLEIRDGIIHGLRQKSGVEFRVPVMDGQPTKYDFTNFRRDFQTAQIKAHMVYPPTHRLHFSPKDLRRTGATWGYRADPKRLLEISAMLGHKRLSTTQMYLGIRAGDIRAVAASVDEMARKAVERYAREVSTLGVI